MNLLLKQYMVTMYYLTNEFITILGKKKKPEQDVLFLHTENC